MWDSSRNLFSKQNSYNAINNNDTVTAPTAPTTATPGTRTTKMKFISSVSNQVLPYCIGNVMVMVVVAKLEEHFLDIWSLQASANGHLLVGTILSLLMVFRLHVAISKEKQLQDCLNVMYQQSRELVQNMAVLSRRSRNTGRTAKEWRNEVAYRSMLLLRTAMALLEYPINQKPVWQVPEISLGMDMEVVCATPDKKYNTPIKTDNNDNDKATNNNNVINISSEWETSMQVPIRIAYLLRQSICSQQERLTNEIPTMQETKLLNFVDEFLDGYYKICQIVNEPNPPVWVPYLRGILFLFVYTTPFVVLSDTSSNLLSHCVSIFLVTYGFVGFELLAVRLEDPFHEYGTDTTKQSKFLLLAQSAFEDTFVVITDTDGEVWADALRYKLHDTAADPIPFQTQDSWLKNDTT